MNGPHHDRPLTSLYPTDPCQAAICDEFTDVVEDIGTQIVATFSLPEDRKRVEREALVARALLLYPGSLQRRLEAKGRLYFADNRLMVADLPLRAVGSACTSEFGTKLPFSAVRSSVRCLGSS